LCHRNANMVSSPSVDGPITASGRSAFPVAENWPAVLSPRFLEGAKYLMRRKCQEDVLRVDKPI
jgi:hypothetical protein